MILPTEDRFIGSLNNPNCRHPEYWHSLDIHATEDEVTYLVAAFVVGLQPDYVIETGTHLGTTAQAIGRALQRNGHGHLDTIEVDPERTAEARLRTVDLPVAHHEMPSLEFTPQKEIDFVWFDSLIRLRVPEFRRYLPHMHSSTVVGFHDTGPQHVLRPLLVPLEEEGLIQTIDLPTPRGVVFARVLK